MARPVNIRNIQIRDPFIVPVPRERMYYLFGTTDNDPWKAPGQGFNAYRSGDLFEWEGPFRVFEADSGFWGTHNFWAPEVHIYRDKFYMFASFIAPERCRGTQILHADNILGPYVPLGPFPVTPAGWECLDGTLYIERNQKPWLVFCHEWVQAVDGEICALPLSDDLSSPIGNARVLFKASDASWTKTIPRRDGTGIADARVTDGPFLWTMENNALLMFWSSISEKGYAMGAAMSESGGILGSWRQNDRPLIDSDGGHGMAFKRFDGSLCLAFHSPNETPLERLKLIGISETDINFFRES